MGSAVQDWRQREHAGFSDAVTRGERGLCSARRPRCGGGRDDLLAWPRRWWFLGQPQDDCGNAERQHHADDDERDLVHWSTARSWPQHQRHAGCAVRIGSARKRAGPPDRFASQRIEKIGGCTRTRTLDPLIKSQLLYQLSYAPGAGRPRSITKRRRFVDSAGGGDRLYPPGKQRRRVLHAFRPGANSGGGRL